MIPEQQKPFIEAVAKFVVEEIEQALKPVTQELARLTLKLEAAELQARELRYAGTWHAQSKYRKGNFVTHNGALWACQIDGIATTPGHDFDGWQLAVKSMVRAKEANA